MQRTSRTLATAWTMLIAATAVASWGSLGAPVIAPTLDYVAAEGSEYLAVIHLDDIVEDAEAPDDSMLWWVSESSRLDIALTRERHLIVKPLDPDWYGSAHVQLSVCNPVGDCTTQTASFQVTPMPDPPTIDWIPSQVVGEAGEFEPVDLRRFGFDPDGDSDLAWSVAGGLWLSAAVVDGVLHVARRDPAWRGTESITLTVADSTGRIATRDVSFTVADDVPVCLTRIPNRPILIQCGDVRIMIDGLLRDMVALSSRDKERLARAEPPFDGIDLALSTHEHYDHVTPEVVIDYLTHSPSTVFASLTETVDLLADVPGFDSVADRVVGIPFDEDARFDLEIPGARVSAFSVRHFGSGNNLALLVEAGGARILVLGDPAFDFASSDLIAAYGWPELDIDVAIVPPRWMDTAGGTLVVDGISPHFAITGRLLECPPRFDLPAGASPPVVLCDPPETWVLPQGEH